ncbi:hypothetical protein SAMN04487955_108158 [Halomonas korlensis]|uniref:Uncharacterized protein n=1 Tax=Halomonas korlensis TaxID=463301 RepID=A0A1I7IYS5_9GAMM|nr:hypothetical protein SAMN04487955_108158 [Halomonas korlensis]
MKKGAMGSVQARKGRPGPIAEQARDLHERTAADSAGKDVSKDGARLTAVTTDGVSGARALARKHLAVADACPSEQPTLRPFLETLFAGVSA